MLRCFVFLIVPFLGVVSLPAQAPAPGSEPVPAAASLFDAVFHAPALAAARARWEAAQARIAVAGRFPDPTLEGMYAQAERPGGGEQFPMWEITLSQPLPRAGARKADRARAAAVNTLAFAEYARLTGELAADVASSLVEADSARARADLYARQLARTRQLLGSFDARVATGAARLSERLALQSRLAALELAAAQEARAAEDADAKIRGRLGLATEVPLPVFAAPAASDIDFDSLPGLQVATARAAEARALVGVVRAAARPMSSLGLRFEREEERMGNMDTVGIAFMTELPFRARTNALAETRAARAEERAALAEGESARYQARAAISRAERADRLAASTRRLATETAARLDAEFDALARANEVSILVALDILDRLTDTRLQLIEADALARTAHAELWSHAPANFQTLRP